VNFSKSNIVLTDCDGVLLDWYAHFALWMGRKGFKAGPVPRDDEYGRILLKVYGGLTEEEHDYYCQQFNCSAWVSDVPPIRDAVFGIKTLYEKHGCTFHVITAFGGDEYSQALRIKNIKRVFGDAITKVTFTPFRGSKQEELNKYKDSGLYYIDDKPRHMESAIEAGLTPVMMAHDYNAMYMEVGECRRDILRIKNWKNFVDIY
jgi:hypothetical protein